MEENKIKTSAEVREELGDKKIGKTYLSEFENGIKEELKRFKDEISHFKPTYSVNHSVSNLKEIEALNKAQIQILSALQKISIPEQIEISEKKEHKIVFTDKTTQFLMWFCSVCFVLAVGGTTAGIYFYQSSSKKSEESGRNGVLQGRHQIYSVISKKEQKKLDENYPKWREK